MNTSTAAQETAPPEWELSFPLHDGWEDLMTPAFSQLMLRLHREFEPRRQELLHVRNQGSGQQLPGFLSRTRAIREGKWQCASLPAQLQALRVELTGPATRKFLINGLNSPAQAFVAQIPSKGEPQDPIRLSMQLNLRDAVNRSITLYDLSGEKFYQLDPQPALLMLAPRPWHESIDEVKMDGTALSAGWLDTALYFFHNAHLLLARGERPYFYLSGIESREEAQLWNEILLFLESELNLPLGQTRVSLLVETLPALFELNEILYALRDYAAAVGCDCRSKLPAGLEHLAFHPELEAPPSLRFGITPSIKEVFSKYLIRTCQHRGILAIGCAGSLEPYEEESTASLAKFRADKVREAKAGFNGTRVGHPRLVEVAQKEFDRYYPISVNS